MKFMKPVLATLVAAGLVSPVFAAHKTSSIVDASTSASAHSLSSLADDASWLDRMHLGGTFRVMVGSVREYELLSGYRVEMPHGVGVGHMNLYFDARASKNVRAHLNLHYSGFSEFFLGQGQEVTEASYDASSEEKYWQNLTFDEAYITYDHFGGARSSFYAQVGKQYLPFSKIGDVYSFTPTITQLFRTMRTNALTLGYQGQQGLSASAFLATDGNYQVLDKYPFPAGSEAKHQPSGRLARAGFDVELQRHYAGFKYDLSAAYINDGYFNTIGASAQRMPFISGFRDYQDLSAGIPGVTYEITPQYTLHAGVKNGPVSVHLDYSKVTKDLIKDIDSKASVLGVGADYCFDMFGKKSSVGLDVDTVSGVKAATQQGVISADRSVVLHADTQLSKRVKADIAYAHYRQWQPSSETVQVFTWSLMAGLRMDI